jgi:hypothetical protein
VRPFEAASRRRAFCTDGSAALAFAGGRALTSTLAGLAAIVISSPVAGLRPARFLVAGLTRTVSWTSPPSRIFCALPSSSSTIWSRASSARLSVRLAHLAAVGDRGDHLGLGQRHGCSSSKSYCLDSGIQPSAADEALF